MEKGMTRERREELICTVCGSEGVYGGIIFKGHCVCDKCVEYMKSGEFDAEVESVESESVRSNVYGSGAPAL